MNEQRAQEEEKKEQQDLCGPKLDGKIKKMLAQLKEKAGLETGQAEVESESERLSTGYTALFSESVKKMKKGDAKAQKDLEALESVVKAHVAFFKLAKNTETPKYVEAETHPKVKYLKECLKDNSLIIPIINKIIDKELLVRDVKITTG